MIFKYDVKGYFLKLAKFLSYMPLYNNLYPFLHRSCSNAQHITNDNLHKCYAHFVDSIKFVLQY